MFCLPFRRKKRPASRISQDTYEEKLKPCEVGSPALKATQLPRNSINKVWELEEEGQSVEESFDAPEPYRPPYIDSGSEPPTYHAYLPHPEIEHPPFPKNAITFALRDSRPPQPSVADGLNRLDRTDTEHEQGQYFNSIKYGDQLNRGLDELRRFQEARIEEVGERSGLTAEQIERRSRLNSVEDEWKLYEDGEWIDGGAFESEDDYDGDGE